MSTLIRLRVTLAGAPVPGGGLATFYSSNADSAGFPAAVKAFYTSLAASCPTGLSWVIPNSGDAINSDTGAINGAWATTGGGTVTCTGGGSYVMGTGARVVWGTGGIRNGRRVKGSTFIVPVVQGAFEGDGQLTSSFITTLSGAATTLMGAVPASFVVWSRPTGASNGQTSTITSVAVPDKVSWLRSRRT